MHYYYRWGQRETSPWLEDKYAAAELTRPASFGAHAEEGRRRDYYFIITAVDINFNWRTLNYTPRRRCVCRELTAKFYIIFLSSRACVCVCVRVFAFYSAACVCVIRIHCRGCGEFEVHRVRPLTPNGAPAFAHFQSR